MTQTPYILWAVLATGGAVAVYFLMRREVAKAKRRADYWRSRLDAYGDYMAEAAQESAEYLTRAKAAEARSDHYASSWGRVMRLLRLAEKANKELRTELLRRQNDERIAA